MSFQTILEGFNPERWNKASNHKKWFGGGSAMYIRDNLSYIRLRNPTWLLSTKCNSVWVKIHSTHGDPLITGTIYRAPNTDQSKFTKLPEIPVPAGNFWSWFPHNLQYQHKLVCKFKSLQDLSSVFHFSQLIYVPTFVSPLGGEYCGPIPCLSKRMY